MYIQYTYITLPQRRDTRRQLIRENNLKLALKLKYLCYNTRIFYIEFLVAL